MLYFLESKICHAQPRRREQLCHPRLHLHRLSFSLCSLGGIQRECEVVLFNALFCGHVPSHRWIVAWLCSIDVTHLLSLHRDIILHVVRGRALVRAFYLQRRVEHLLRNAGVQLTLHISTKPWFEPHGSHEEKLNLGASQVREHSFNSGLGFLKFGIFRD